MAVLAAANSAADAAEVLGAVTAGSILDALGILGAPVFRVNVAMAAGLAWAEGFSFASARATRAPVSCGLTVLGVVEGVSDDLAEVT